MTRMEDPSERLGKIVGWVEYAGDVAQDNVASIFPVLNGKELDQDVTRAVGRDAGIDHFDGRLVVTIHRGGGALWKTQLAQYGT